MKPDYSKVFGRAIIACWVVIISCWAISLFRPEWFLIVVENDRVLLVSVLIESMPVLRYSFSFVLSSFCMIFYWLACLGVYKLSNKIDFLKCMGMITLAVFLKPIDPVVNYAIDIICLFIMPIRGLKASVKNTAYCAMYYSLYVFMVSNARSLIFQSLSWGLLENTIVALDCYIYIIFMYLYSALKGGICHGYLRHFAWRGQESIASYACRARRCYHRNRRKTSRAERRVNRQLTIRKVRSYAIVFGCMGATAYLTSHFLEMIILFLAYLSLRWTFPETFHAYKPINCTIISSVVFSFLVAIAVPIGISLVTCVIMALILSWQLYREWDYRNLGGEAVVKDMKIQEFEEHFNPEEQALKKLRDKGFNEIYQQIVILYSIQGMTMKEVSEIVGYGEQVCKNYFGKVTKVFPEFKKCSKKS